MKLLFTILTCVTAFIPPTSIVKTAMQSKNYIDQWTYNDFSDNLKNIDSAALIDNQNVAIFSQDNILHTLKYASGLDNIIINNLIKQGVDFQIFDIPQPENVISPFVQIVGGYFIIMIILNIIRNNGPINPMNMMNKEVNMVESDIETTFEDVAGLDEAKEELVEIVDFLKNPLKYEVSGAKIPKGILLEGPPGTGKTLMARALAGEAGVSFVYSSASEFIEMFVGVGAQRIRRLFDTARASTPCVIFIDEIDAIGAKRGNGFSNGGSEEREQTLNQLLTCMDGFEKETGIIVIAATNRADTLDSALKRSGRFDRKIKINLPDYRGRQEIAKVHFGNKLNSTIDYKKLASLTQGFSGADLEVLANEAAILSVRNNDTNINNTLMLQAFEKMTIGLPKKYETRSEETLRLVAGHEMGHAIIVKYFDIYFNLQKVTLNSNTAGAGGYTLFTPKDKYMEYPTKGFYLAQIMVALGGRAAEILMFEESKTKYEEFSYYSDLEITTGAAADLQQAYSLGVDYLRLFDSYLPSSASDSSKGLLEEKVEVVIFECLEKSIKILRKNKGMLTLFIDRLIKEKTITLN